MVHTEIINYTKPKGGGKTAHQKKGRSNMFTGIEIGIFMFCLTLAFSLLFAFGYIAGSDSVKKRVFKKFTEYSDPWDALDSIREEVTGN